MNNYKIVISKRAKKDFNKLDSKTQKIMRNQIKKLKRNPYERRYDIDIKQLIGSSNPVLYRLRVGKYRIVYAIVDDQIMIFFVQLRKKVYSLIKNIRFQEFLREVSKLASKSKLAEKNVKKFSSKVKASATKRFMA